MSQEITLKSCPFCGSCDYKLFNIVKPYYIYCIHCHTHGPETNQGNQQAAHLWNTRSQAEALNELKEKIVDAAMAWGNSHVDYSDEALLAPLAKAVIDLREARVADKGGSDAHHSLSQKILATVSDWAKASEHDWQMADKLLVDALMSLKDDIAAQDKERAGSVESTES